MTARPRPLTALPLTAHPRVMRRLLEASIGVASLSTLAGGVLAIGQVGGPVTSLVVASSGPSVEEPDDASLLAAQATPALRADLDALQLVEVEPVADLVERMAGPTSTAPTTTAPSAPVTSAAPVTTLATAPEPTTTTVPPTTSTTVPAPTTTTTPTTVAGSGAAPADRVYSPDEVKAIIVEVFGPEHGPAAIRVANCESRLNPRAVSRGGGNWGLFQLNTVHKARVQRMGYAWEDVLDPRVNSVVAKQIFDGSGWRPWACKP